MRLVKPALIAYQFVPRVFDDESQRDAVLAYLESHWRACRALGMGAPFGSFPHPAEIAPLIARGHAPTFRILAGTRRPPGTEIYVSFVFTLADTAGSIAVLAPNEDGAGQKAWNDLYGAWLGALRGAERPPRPDAVLGEAVVFTALSRSEGGAPADAELTPLAASVFPALAAARSCSVQPGVSLWEVPRRYDRRRKLVAVAPEPLERELDGLLWWDETGGSLAALADYLLNAAKVRHAFLLLLTRLDRIREQGAEVDRHVTQMLELLGDRSAGRGVMLETLIDAQEGLIQAQGEAGGLLHVVTRLRELRETVQIARENMDASRPTAERLGPFEQDAGLVEWVTRQVDHELVYAEARKDRADEARALASRWLEGQTETYTRQQGNLTLYQTAILSALLAALGAIQALGAEVEVGNRRFDFPIVAAVAAVVLALPLLFVHFFERYSLLDRAAAGLLGASVGWLTASAAGLDDGTAGSLALIVGLCAFFFFATFVIDWWVDRRRRRRAAA